MFLGIDLGTSSVKAVLVDGDQRVVDHESAPLEVSRPHPLWSEQDPADWWRAADHAVRALSVRRARDFSGVRGIGLSGQMHGATLLDPADRVLRPAILWNDGRAAAECRELESREPRCREITGNAAMPGFTAPKLLWVARHEPDVFARTARVLLPKDWLRLQMTGEAISDPSDASGTLWLDVGRRRWSPEMLAATRLPETAMPRLVEGSEPGGTLRDEVARDWSLPQGVVVAGSAGDNAAGAVGVGAIADGDAMLSLGTSGVLFAAGSAFRPNPRGGVHAFCHAIPGTWHQMAVLLSAASCLSWLEHASGCASVADLLGDEDDPGVPPDPGMVFLPYLSGERTPHEDPLAKGVFFGLSHSTTRADLGRAVLEGGAFAFADGADALRDAGTRIGRVSLVGGGARSRLWSRILASALGRELSHASGAEVGPAFGAARLARLAAGGEDPRDVCRPLPVDRTFEPEPELVGRYEKRRALFRELYRDLRPRFGEL
ncbi:MAG: xylulokinase [Alphaproteobacteria bacterium]